MPGLILDQQNKRFLRIVDGILVERVDDEVEGARLRKWELPTGEKGETLEVPYLNWEGVIQNVRIKASQYGDNCLVEFEDAVVSLATDSRYFKDFACKYFNLDLELPIVFHPYKMEVDGRKLQGVSVTQNGKKVQSYFYDGKKNLHGFPEVDDSKKDKKSYWKMYFAEVSDFLIDCINDDNRMKEAAKNELEISDLPF